MATKAELGQEELMLACLLANGPPTYGPDTTKSDKAVKSFTHVWQVDIGYRAQVCEWYKVNDPSSLPFLTPSEFVNRFLFWWRDNGDKGGASES